MERSAITNAGGEIRKPLSRAARIAGERLLEGTQSFAQAMQAVEVDMSGVEELKAAYCKAGKRLSSTAVYIKAIAVALGEFPQLNARLEGREIVQYTDINPGIAVDTPGGLYVVVLRAVQDKSLEQINAELSELLARTRQNKLTLDDMQGSTITISNMSMTHVDFFTSLVNNFETLILGFGQVKNRPLADEEGNIAVRKSGYVMANINHTLTSGVPANRFLERLTRILEGAGAGL